MTATLDRPCERWSLQETHEAHKFSHTDGWATCPGWGQPLTDQQLRDQLVEALTNAHRTQPCSCGSRTWASCFHDGKLASHQERRADAVLAVVQPELDRLRAELEQTRQQALTEAAEIASTVIGPLWHLDTLHEIFDRINAAAHPTSAVRACGCPSRFDRHADGCPTLTAETTR